jgi:hypothetical protein
LLEGPTNAESAADLNSAINPGTRLLGLTISDGIARVNLDDTFNGEETPSIAVGSLSQIVYTLTQFDSIDGVLFEVDGTPLTNFGGYEIDGAQRRADFGDELPFILVQGPAIGDRVSSPVFISGTADVFEAVVSIEILDQQGRTVASTFTMATCGTGCRGTYEASVRYDVATTQPGTIRVYEVSRHGRLGDPRGGHPRHAHGVIRGGRRLRQRAFAPTLLSIAGRRPPRLVSRLGLRLLPTGIVSRVNDRLSTS